MLGIAHDACGNGELLQRRSRHPSAPTAEHVQCVERDRENAVLLLILRFIIFSLQPTYCRPLVGPSGEEQKKGTPVQKEFGFSSFSMPIFNSLIPYKPNTVEAKSSLTGLPVQMSFQQQMGRGWFGPTVRTDQQA